MVQRMRQNTQDWKISLGILLFFTISVTGVLSLIVRVNQSTLKILTTPAYGQNETFKR
jgi:uncharacterized membrane protein